MGAERRGPGGRGRLLAAVVIALAGTAAVIAALYAGAGWLTATLPDWLLLVVFMVLGVALVGSPLMALRYTAQWRAARHRPKDHDHEDHTR